MRRARYAVGALLTFCGCSFAFGAAAAAAGITCGEFSVQVEYSNVEFLDLGEEGVTVGDKRYGHQRLTDENGNHVGDQYFEAVILPSSGDGPFNHLVRGHSVFANGTIDWGGTGPLTDPRAPGNPGSLDGVSRSVTGGTGDFAGASGTVMVFYDRETGGRREFDIICRN